MPPGPMYPTAAPAPALRRPFLNLPAARRMGGSACALLLCGLSLPALAQAAPPAPRPVDQAGTAAQDMPANGAQTPGVDAQGNREIAFEADELTYNQDTNVVTASGNVLLRSGDQSVRAQDVSWDRDTGVIVATGDIRLVDQDGNQLFTDRVELTDELKAGAMTNLLLAFREGARLAAEQGTRNDDGDVVLTKAVYSACPVEDEHGCEKSPSWRVTARRVIYDAETQRIKFEGGRLELFSKFAVPLPGLVIRADGGPISGFIMPDLGLTASNGLEVNAGYYWRLGDNRDLLATLYTFTEAAPMASAEYRSLTQKGAFQITAYGTYGSRIPLAGVQAEKDFRGSLFANGKFQLDPNWSISGTARVATDRTFLRRYDISRDDRLRSNINVERISSNSYLSIAGWATQALLVQQEQGMVPVALPVVDFRQRLKDPALGGTVELRLNTLAITRTAGQDTQRAFTQAQWNLRQLTPWGQEISFTAMARGDVYHSSQNMLTTTPSYRGESGWHTRGVALGAVDAKWPLVGEFLGGTQVLTPRVQLVATPAIQNLAIPNEDARAIELEDSNLFALNRFPGYDRIEDGVRFTYGADWQLTRPGWQVKATIGQSYRLTDEPTLFPNGTGLREEFSDFVGRTEIRFRDNVKFTHRYRVDKDNFAVRRNEIDAAVGSDATYIELGYLRLNRDIDLNFEDLQDREEARVAGRLAFARYWSVFGSAVVNLTNRREDPSFTADGFEPLRTRLGVAYEDDCLEFGFTWRRDYISLADARKGNSFRIYFSLRNLGFR